MTSGWYEDDDQLLEELGVALAEEAPGPEDVAMIMTGYDIVMADTLEAALLHDSEADSVAALRSETAGARMLAFGTDGIEIEFELADGRVVGHIDPPRPGRILLEQPTITGQAVTEGEADDLGAFEFTLRRAATFRLRFVGDDGRSIATGWVDGPHRTAD